MDIVELGAIGELVEGVAVDGDRIRFNSVASATCTTRTTAS